jgi:hypothetical protein
MDAALVDELVSGVVDVIKIDVEGYEMEALTECPASSAITGQSSFQR